MNDIDSIIQEAKHFRDHRAILAKDVESVTQKRLNEENAVTEQYNEAIQSLDRIRIANEQMIQTAAQNRIQDYANMRLKLENYGQPVQQWCAKDVIRQYCPDASHIDEHELADLLSKIQEEGFAAWIKRTFRLGGYASRQEMVTTLYQKIEDGKALCDIRIQEISRDAKHEIERQRTQTRREKDAALQRLSDEKQEIYRKMDALQKKNKEALSSFTSSSQLGGLRKRIQSMQDECNRTLNDWGVFEPAKEIPKKVPLCNVIVQLPDVNGISTDYKLPYWMNIDESNVIIIKKGSRDQGSYIDKDALFAQKILARMLKMVPPEQISYTVFDLMGQGKNLSRLVDVTNLGTTEIEFSLFTAEDGDTAHSSARLQRKNLLNRPADIIKAMGGSYHSLYEYNKRNAGSTQYPFTWIVEFGCTSTVSHNLYEFYSKLFINASTAGYSFILVGDDSTAEEIKKAANRYRDLHVYEIDCNTNTLSAGSGVYPIHGDLAPTRDQIYNFTTALTKYYEAGKKIDNRLLQVTLKNGVIIRDASKSLRIPIAMDSRGNLIELNLGGNDSAHGFISGGTGSGKTSLLHTIILQACLYHTPEDLEIWLVDYKQTEFYLYLDRTPPHIKLIGISQTEDFTFSFLERITEELRRRQDLFTKYRAQSLSQYRNHAAEQGFVPLPRLFIIVDEFHQMSQFVETSVTHKEMLENIVREARMLGISLLLSDQGFSNGLGGLTTSAKDQLGVRIAMRNDQNRQEIKNTLAVDNNLFTPTIDQATQMMTSGDFIMKTRICNKEGVILSVNLDKYKAIYSDEQDVLAVGKLLRKTYAGWPMWKQKVFVNTKERVWWSDEDITLVNALDPITKSNTRLYLGRAATIRPCFNIDLGHKPDENVSIVGGTAGQRWELLVSVLRSCFINNYETIVFMDERSSIAMEYADEIRATCDSIPNAELCDTMEQWCWKLRQLEHMMDSHNNRSDIICVFIGLETAADYMNRILRNRGNERLFDGRPIITRLLSEGGYYGIRSVAEFDVFRNMNNLIKVEKHFSHKIALKMSADDCTFYLGSSNFEKSIGDNAVYSNGGKSIRKLIPYKH